MALYLASKSPRRKKLLSKVFSKFSTLQVPPPIHQPLRNARNQSRAMAEYKAQWASLRHPGDVVIGADTAVECNGRAFEKPSNSKEAAKFLKYFSGRKLYVYTSTCLAKFDGRKKIRKKLWTEICKLRFEKLKKKEIEEYAKSKKWKGKAGGFNISEYPAKKWIAITRGKKEQVMGLGLDALEAELRKF